MSSGILRRIDELGRIVIPKELRRSMHINVGDEMEISRAGDALEIKKHSRFEEQKEVVSATAKLLSCETGAKVLVVDLEKVVLDVGGDKKKYQDRVLSGSLAKAVLSRRAEVLHGEDLKDVFEEGEADCQYLVFEPVEACGDAFGGMALLLKTLPSDVARAYLGFCAKLVGAALA
ncbi:MAG: AbrB/MazE/SpoVT family DNA-binding domain-containing protein [Clostridia bacterium]|nr:AbrB/MazE/SpoVT family DNA-binding domain-containing protein [Clostridia bacterium]